MHPSPAVTPFEQRLAYAIAALDLGELLQLDAMLAPIEDPVEDIAAVGVFLSVFVRRDVFRRLFQP